MPVGLLRFYFLIAGLAMLFFPQLFSLLSHTSETNAPLHLPTALMCGLFLSVSFWPRLPTNAQQILGNVFVFAFEAPAIYIYAASGFSTYYLGTTLLATLMLIFILRDRRMLGVYWVFVNMCMTYLIVREAGLPPEMRFEIPSLFFTVTTAGVIVQNYFTETLIRSKQLSEALAEKSQELTSLLETGPVLVCRLDPWMQISYQNHAFRQAMKAIWGETYEEALKNGEIFPEAVAMSAFNQHFQIALIGEKTQFTIQTQAQAGGKRVYEAYLTPISSQGQVVSVALFAHDISIRKQLEEEVARTQERFANAIAAAKNGIWEWDLGEGTVYFSPRWKEMLGYTDAELPNHTSSWERVIHPEDKTRILTELKKLIKGKEEVFEKTFRMVHKSGSTVWIYARGKAVRNAEGRTLRLSGSHTDITREREAEAELRKISIVAHKTSNGVVISGPDRKIEWANESFRQMSGYSMEEMQGKTPGQLLHGPLTDREAINRMRNHLQRKTPVVEEVLNYHKSGTPFWVRVTITPVLNDAGEVEKFISIQDDISSRKKTEQELRLAKQHAEDATRAKTEFLANMSHEIRTPLNAVIGITGLLQDSNLTEDQRDLVSTLRISGDNLLALVNEILDFSKIEAGKLRLDPTPVDIAALVDEVIEIQASRATQAKLELYADIHPDTPDWILADPNRINQVLLNLVSNAIKFTPTGNVSIHVAPVKRDAESVTLRFAVKDTGIGIPANRHHVLFNAFSQVSGSNSRKFGGVGLGLAISQKLVTLMGGVIRVESEEGKGSEFSFLLTFGIASKPAIHQEPIQFGEELALVCITHAGLRQSISHLLQKARIKPIGIAGCSEMKEWIHSGRTYDLTICDGGCTSHLSNACSTPEFELAHLPRSILLQLAGHPLPASLTDKFTVTLTRPLRRNQFLRTVGELLLQEKAPQVSVGELLPDFSMYPHANILLVEDNLVNQKVALRTLNRLGLQAAVANNGLEAVEACRKTPFDLILMDIQMPEMDGYEATQAIRELPAPQPCIIALTANALADDRQRCIHAGMDDYLSKPYKAAQLGRILQQWLPKRAIPKEQSAFL